jgi:hypothetical protein
MDLPASNLLLQFTRCAHAAGIGGKPAEFKLLVIAQAGREELMKGVR